MEIKKHKIALYRQLKLKMLSLKKNIYLFYNFFSLTLNRNKLRLIKKVKPLYVNYPKLQNIDKLVKYILSKLCLTS